MVVCFFDKDNNKLAEYRVYSRQVQFEVKTSYRHKNISIFFIYNSDQELEDIAQNVWTVTLVEGDKVLEVFDLQDFMSFNISFDFNTTLQRVLITKVV